MDTPSRSIGDIAEAFSVSMEDAKVIGDAFATFQSDVLKRVAPAVKALTEAVHRAQSPAAYPARGGEERTISPRSPQPERPANHRKRSSHLG